MFLGIFARKEQNMKYRHEWKHEINYADILILRSRLLAIMKPDEHATNGKYQICSLYFDTLNDKALREKIDGINFREKFRIRFYNNDTSHIVLEKKSKINNLCEKESCQITKEETKKIIDGDISWMINSERPLCQELYSKMLSLGLKPKTIVQYVREPFVFGPGNVRVTIDYNIRTGMNYKDFLSSEPITIPAGDSPIILEVKWDEFLPSIVKDAITIPGRRASAFSKYAQCRVYG